MGDQADDIKSKVDSAYHPETFVIPYDSALFIEFSTYYYVTRKLIDVNYPQADLQAFVEARLLRLVEYQTFIALAREETLKGFYSDWKVHKSEIVDCVTFPLGGDDDYNRCWICGGDYRCLITSEYLEPTANVDCRQHCEHASGQYCPHVPSCGALTGSCGVEACEAKYQEMLSGETHSKLSVTKMLENMDVALQAANRNLGTVFRN